MLSKEWCGALLRRPMNTDCDSALQIHRRQRTTPTKAGSGGNRERVTGGNRPPSRLKWIKALSVRARRIPCFRRTVDHHDRSDADVVAFEEARAIKRRRRTRVGLPSLSF